jgi:methylmalonyl-CoA mutase
LKALEDGARGNANLLDLAIKAGRAKATVGEISMALENAFGRHKAVANVVTGVYRKEIGALNEAFGRARDMVASFKENDGRLPRILVAKMGQDGHDRGQKVIASAFSDLGFDVDVGDLFSTPEEAAKEAIAKNVHVVGVSTLAAGHLTLVPALKAALDQAGRSDIMIVVGGVIPEQDFDALRRAGADAIFPPGTVVSDAAMNVLDKLNERRGFRQVRR